MRIQFSEIRKKFPLSRKTIFKRTVQATLLLIILLLAMYFFGVYTFELDFNTTSIVAGSIILLVIIVAYLYESAYYSSYFYDLTDSYLIIKKDPIMPREITVPYDRIVSVTIDRDPFDFFLGLCDLHINTSTSAYLGMEAHIDGLSRAAANGLEGVIKDRMMEAKAVASNSESKKSSKNYL